MLVDGDAGDDLGLVAGAGAGFGGVGVEAFGQQDVRDEVEEGLGDLGVAGKGQVIGVAGVGGVKAAGDSVQAGV